MRERSTVARTVGIVHLILVLRNSASSISHPLRRFEEAASVRHGCGAQGNPYMGTSLRGPCKSDKAPAIITDGAKKWRRGTDG